MARIKLTVEIKRLLFLLGTLVENDGIWVFKKEWTPGQAADSPRVPVGVQREGNQMSRLRDRVVKAAGTSGELTLYELDRATEIVCARCAGRSTTKWVAVLGGNWTSLWCKSCFLVMPNAHLA